ncbi:MAG: hypothetical protein V1855_04980, partial [bacterium]
MKKSIILLITLCVLGASSLALQKGSSTVVSIEDAVTFPAVDSDNQMLTFGYFKNGFSLEDASTTCTFYSIFPVAGDVSLHGGRICLDTDLIFQNVTNLNTSGYFYGNQHVLDFCESVTGFPGVFNTTFEDTKVFLNSDLYLDGIVIVKGNCTINGRKNRILFKPGGHIVINPGATLRLKNVELDGVLEDSLWCVNDSAALYLDNMRWAQDANYTFSRGSITFANTVEFVGPHTFCYESDSTSTIQSDSMWNLSDIVTLSIGRKNGFYDREPLYFTDSTSIMKIENSTLQITSSGMKLTRGTLLGDGEVNFDVQCTHSNGALMLGDGTAQNDFMLKLYPEAAFKLVGGDIVYNVVSSNNFLADEISVRFVHDQPGTNFYVLQDIIFNNVTLKLGSAGLVTVCDDKKLFLDDCNVQFGTADYVISGTRLNDYYDALYQNDTILLKSGDYPKLLYVYKDGNSVDGAGNFAQTVTLHNSASEIMFSFDGRFFGNIILNGGTAIFSNNAIFAQDVFFTGSGTVRLNSNQLVSHFYDESITATLRLEAPYATLLFEGDTALTSQLTFSGDWEINSKGNILDLTGVGSIIVDKNSTLRISNTKIVNLAENNIRCFDDSAKIIFDGSCMHLSNSYSFTAGSMSIVDDVYIHEGTHTFSYASALTSTINKYSRLHVESGSNFSIGRKNGYGREPLYFTDETARLVLDNATFTITSSGARLSRGSFTINNDVTLDILSSSTTHGLTVGDGLTDGDMTFNINPAATLHVPQGTMIYDGYGSYLFRTNAKNAVVDLGASYNTHLLNDCLLQNLQMRSCLTTGLSTENDANFVYDHFTVLWYDTEYQITGKRYNYATNLLDGDGEIIVKTGSLPMATLVTGAGNSLYGLGGVSEAIVLQGSDAELTVGLAGLVEADITLGGGTVTLSRDLEFSDNHQFQGQGTVAGDNCTVLMGPQDFTMTSSITWQGTNKTINLDSDVLLTSSMKIKGNCILAGNGNYLQLHDSGIIFIEKDSQLTLRDISIKSLSGNKIRCFDDSGKIIFNNVYLEMSDDYSFTTGSLSVVNSLDVRGTYTFSLDSGTTSTVQRHSQLIVKDGACFAIGRKTLYGPEPLHFEDATSEVKFDKSIWRIKPHGVHVINGTFIVNRDVTLDIISTSTVGGLMAGDGQSQVHDFNFYLNPSSTFSLPRGHVVYNCVGDRFFVSKSRSAKIIFGADFHIDILKNFTLSQLTTDPTNLVHVTLGPEALVFYDAYSEESAHGEYEMSGIMYSATTNLLTGNNAVIIRTGSYQYSTLVMGTGNSISGIGSVDGDVTFMDSSAALTMGIAGQMRGDIVLGGGTLTLSRDLKFSEDHQFRGEGIVAGDNVAVDTGPQDLTITGTVTWSGTGRTINLNADTLLTSSLRVRGNCLLKGNGKNLQLHRTGIIFVEKDSTLTLRDISIAGVHDNNIQCFDDSSKIVLDNALLEMDGDYSFTTGSITFFNRVDIRGTYTFAMESSVTSTVIADSEIMIKDGPTFAAGRQTSGGREPLYFEDNTAFFRLQNATLKVLPHGMNLTRGRFILDYDNTIDIISTSTANGLLIGNGAEGAGDFHFHFNPAATLNLIRGHFVFNGYDGIFVVSKSRDAKVVFG